MENEWYKSTEETDFGQQKVRSGAELRSAINVNDLTAGCNSAPPRTKTGGRGLSLYTYP